MPVIIVKDKTKKTTIIKDENKADMSKTVYDTNNSGVVDNAEKVNGKTVETNVPTNAEFTDTIVTKNDLGLERVDNTNDSEKEISTAAQSAFNNRIIPLFPYVEGEVQKNTETTRNGWNMISNKITSDLPDPQNTGSPENSIKSDAILTTASNVSVIEVVIIATAIKTGFLKELEIYTPFWDTDSISIITYHNITTGKTTTLDNKILRSGDWTIIGTSSIFIKIGEVIRVSFKYYNSSAANSIDGGWTSKLATGEPLTAQLNLDNLTAPTAGELHHTDLDTNDRSTELDGVVSGSIVRVTETGDVDRNIEFEVDTVDLTSIISTKYTVLLGSVKNGAKNIRADKTCTIHIDVPITQPSEYSVVADYYPTNNPTWATITTELYYGGVLQADAGDYDGYGINLLFQEAVVSDDWYPVSVNLGDTGSSSLSGGLSSVSIKKADLAQILATGVIAGGFMTPNTDTTIFDISDGSGLIVDAFTDPENPTYVKISWSGLTGITPTYIASDNLSFIGINSSGVVVQQATPFTNEQRRDIIVWGSIIHTDRVNITSSGDLTHDVLTSYLTNDFANAIGDINIFGNHFDPASTDLTICKTAGRSFRENSNRKNNLKDPHYLDAVLINPLTFLRAYNDGSSGVTIEGGQTDIDPDSWDDGSGVKATVSANKWTNKWCYYIPSSEIVIVRLGTVEYSNLADAQAGILTDLPPTIGTGLDENFIRTVISVKVGSTDLSDIAEAVFKHTGKFGLL